MAESRLGSKVRSLRRRQGLTQAKLAENLGISTSYLNLIENNRRPLSAPVLIKLAQLFQVGLQTFSSDEEDELLAELMEVFGDPIFDPYELSGNDVRELASHNPSGNHVNPYKALPAIYPMGEADPPWMQRIYPPRK
jgi:transcriptional regulator with XRE-family HTH domain